MKQCVSVEFCCAVCKKIRIKVPELYSFLNAFMDNVDEINDMLEFVFHIILIG